MELTACLLRIVTVAICKGDNSILDFSRFDLTD